MSRYALMDWWMYFLSREKCKTTPQLWSGVEGGGRARRRGTRSWVRTVPCRARLARAMAAHPATCIRWETSAISSTIRWVLLIDRPLGVLARRLLYKNFLRPVARFLNYEELSRIKSSPPPPHLPRPGRSLFDSTLRPHEQLKNLTSGQLVHLL